MDEGLGGLIANGITPVPCGFPGRSLENTQNLCGLVSEFKQWNVVGVGRNLSWPPQVTIEDEKEVNA